MSAFITRVELHSPQQGDYDKLHNAMEDAGFSRTIQWGGPPAYHLPTAEYIRVSDQTADQVLQLAVKAAASVRQTFGVLVCRSAETVQQGLKPV